MTSHTPLREQTVPMSEQRLAEIVQRREIALKPVGKVGLDAVFDAIDKDIPDLLAEVARRLDPDKVADVLRGMLNRQEIINDLEGPYKRRAIHQNEVIHAKAKLLGLTL